MPDNSSSNKVVGISLPTEFFEALMFMRKLVPGFNFSKFVQHRLRDKASTLGFISSRQRHLESLAACPGCAQKNFDITRHHGAEHVRCTTPDCGARATMDLWPKKEAGEATTND